MARGRHLSTEEAPVSRGTRGGCAREAPSILQRTDCSGRCVCGEVGAGFEKSRLSKAVLWGAVVTG